MKELLSFIDQYTRFTPEEWKELAEGFRLKHFGPNDHFLLAGNVATQLGFITEGAAHYYYTTSEGRQSSLEFILDKGFISDWISYSTQSPSYINIQFLERSKVILLDWTKKKVSREVRYKLLQLKTVYMERNCLRKNSLLQLIISESRPEERYKLIHVHFPEYILRIPQKLLASWINVSPETLSRAKKRFLDLNQLMNAN